MLNKPRPFAGVSLVLGEKLYEFLKESEGQVSALELVLRHPQPRAPTARLHSQLYGFASAHLREYPASGVTTLCWSFQTAPRCLAGDTACIPGPLCAAGLQATQAELSSDSSNPWLVVFIDPIHVLSEEGIRNLLQMLVRTKPASDSKGPPSRVMDGDLFHSCL